MSFNTDSELVLPLSGRKLLMHPWLLVEDGMMLQQPIREKGFSTIQLKLLLPMVLSTVYGKQKKVFL
tara:strand:- start:117 stop:317 length:201 start_codon:yes stop_codon:yes gene_type:complete